MSPRCATRAVLLHATETTGPICASQQRRGSGEGLVPVAERPTPREEPCSQDEISRAEVLVRSTRAVTKAPSPQSGAGKEAGQKLGFDGFPTWGLAEGDGPTGRARRPRTPKALCARPILRASLRRESGCGDGELIDTRDALDRGQPPKPLCECILTRAVALPERALASVGMSLPG